MGGDDVIKDPYPHELDEGTSDVVIDGIPADNEVLAYDSGTGNWINQTAAEAGLTSLPIPATSVEVAELGTATYDDVQDYVNFFGDRTLLSGGAITDAGSGVAAIASLTAWCKETNSLTAVGKFFNYGGDSTAALTDMTTHYIYVDYNGGTPQLVTATDKTTHGFKLDHILVGTIFRDGATLHFHEVDKIGIGRVNRTDMHHREEHPAHRADGLVTSDGGSLALSITSGVIYEGVSRHATTVNGSTWSYWSTANSGSTWTEDTGISALVQSYNNIASGKVSLGSNKFGVHWVYVDLDGSDLHILYGQGNYTANQAEEAAVPSVVPNILTNYAVLIAKIINQEGTNTLTITYPWTDVFTSSLATDHGSLGGLGDPEDHAWAVEGPASSTDNALALFDGATGKLLKDSLHTLTNDGTKSTLLGISGDYLRIGNAGITDHSLNSEDDLLVTGELEVDGDAMFDGPTITFGVNTNVHILGKITLAENAPIVLDSVLSADGKYSGIVEAGTAGATLAFGEVCYLKTIDSEWYEAKADAAVTSGGVKLGICVVAGTDGNTTTMLRYGKIRADTIFPTFTIGTAVYISAATAGLLTSTAPTGTTDFVVRIAGHANTGDEIAFEPDNSYVELA